MGMERMQKSRNGNSCRKKDSYSNPLEARALFQPFLRASVCVCVCVVERVNVYVMQIRFIWHSVCAYIYFNFGSISIEFVSVI